MTNDKLNISVIVLDTMRADIFYDMLKKDRSSVFSEFYKVEKCISPESWTLPAHASLFTGMYPSQHGCHETRTVKALDIEQIKLRKKTIVTELKSKGYKTYGISANPYLHPVYGFDEFDVFKEESYFTDNFGSVFEVSEKLKPLIAKYRNVYGANALKISIAMLKEDPNLFLETAATSLFPTFMSVFKKLKAKAIEGWPLEKGGKNIVKNIKETKFKEPFFLFANFMEAHEPYVGKKGKDFNWPTPFMIKKTEPELVRLWKKLYIKASKKAYNYGIKTAETLLSRFGENQMIIITSDHGQCFGEHGFIGHGTMLYDEIVRVPLIIHIPSSFRSEKSKQFSSLVNIKQFIMSALGGEENAAAKLYSKEVFAQSFGIPANLSGIKGIDKNKVRAGETVKTRKFK